MLFFSPLTPLLGFRHRHRRQQLQLDCAQQTLYLFPIFHDRQHKLARFIPCYSFPFSSCSSLSSHQSSFVIFLHKLGTGYPSNKSMLRWCARGLFRHGIALHQMARCWCYLTELSLLFLPRYRWNSNGTVRDRRTSRMGISAYDHRQRAIGPLPSPVYLDTKAPLLTFMSRSKILASNGLKPQVEPLYSDPLPGTLEAVPVCSASPISSKFRRPEPIYATLSETMSSSNTLESLSRSRRNASRHRAMDSEDEGSATESAGDDFEFHNTRSSRQTLVIHDAVMEHSRKSPDFISHQPTVKQDDVQLKPRAKVTRSATYRILCNGLDVKCAKRQDPQSTLTTSSESQHGIVTCITFQVKIPLLYPPIPPSLPCSYVNAGRWNRHLGCGRSNS